MQNAMIQENKAPSDRQKRVPAFLCLTVVSSLVMTIVSNRHSETQQLSTTMIMESLIFLLFFAALYAIPFATDGYHVLVPAISTAFLTALLIISAPVHMRLMLESAPSPLAQALVYLIGAASAMFFSLLYTICAALLTKDAKEEGLPPVFHNMSKKAYRILYGVLIGVLLITGVTTSVIHYVKMVELNAYAVSENDYPTVMPNLRVAVRTGNPETVPHGLDHIDYATIDGVDHHEFLYAQQTEWVLLGTEVHKPIILRAKDHTADPAANASIKEITLTGKADIPVTPALKAQIEKIVRGQGTPYEGENEPNKYNVSHHKAQDLTVTVSFEGYDAFVWCVPVVEFEGHYLLEVETLTEFRDKGSIFNPTYTYYVLPKLQLPAVSASNNRPSLTE